MVPLARGPENMGSADGLLHTGVACFVNLSANTQRRPTRATVQRGGRPGCAFSGPRARGGTEHGKQDLFNIFVDAQAWRRPGMGPAPAHPNHPPCHPDWRAATRPATEGGALPLARYRRRCRLVVVPVGAGPMPGRARGGVRPRVLKQRAVERCGGAPGAWAGEHGLRRRPAARTAGTHCFHATTARNANTRFQLARPASINAAAHSPARNRMTRSPSAAHHRSPLPRKAGASNGAQRTCLQALSL